MPAPTTTTEPEPGVFDLIDLMTGYQAAAALTAASRLGVFTVLHDAPMTHDEVATVLETEPLATRALLDALAGLGLARASADGFVGVPITRRLAAGGDLQKVVEKEAFFARQWLDLGESVRTGAPRIAPWRERVASEPERARSFLEALVVLATETGPDLTSLPGFAPGLQVADFGGGLGAYATQLAGGGAHVTLVDLPEVAPWARRALDAGEPDVARRVVVQPLDLLDAGAVAALRASRPDGFDVVLLSHLLHDLDDAECLQVLTVARRVLAPAGRVVVFELPGDPPGAFGPLFDLMMRVETPGRARRLDELRGLMLEAGLGDVHVSPGFALPHGVLVGSLR